MASNNNSYFAVTGHWIEETEPQKWTLQHALFGFMQMNTAHNEQQLGQALFKICNRLNIMHKVIVFVLFFISLLMFSPLFRLVILHVIMLQTTTPCLLSLHIAIAGKMESYIMRKSSISGKHLFTLHIKHF